MIFKINNQSWILNYPGDAALSSANQMEILVFKKKEEGRTVFVPWFIGLVME